MALLTAGRSNKLFSMLVEAMLQDTTAGLYYRSAAQV